MQKNSFKMFISGRLNKNLGLINAVKDFLDENLEDNYEMEVIDVLNNLNIALEYNIAAAPALVIETPLPVKVITGDLCDTQKFIEELRLSIAIDNTNIYSVD